MASSPAEETPQMPREPSNATRRLHNALCAIRGGSGATMQAILPVAMKREGEYPALAFHRSIVLIIRMIDASEREVREKTAETSHSFLLQPFPELRNWLGPGTFTQSWSSVRNNFTDAHLKALEHTAHFVSTLSHEVSLLQPELQGLNDLLQELIQETVCLDVTEPIRFSILNRLHELERAIADYSFLGPEAMVDATDGMIGVYIRNEESIEAAEKKAVSKNGQEQPFSKKFREVVKRTGELANTANAVYTIAKHLLPAGHAITNFIGMLGN